MNTSSKADLRRLARERLGALSADEIAAKSARICEIIAALPAWRDAGIAAFFAAQAAEPDLAALWQSAQGKTICYPRVNGTDLDIIAVESPAALQTSRWQLREPFHDEQKIIAPEQLDLIFVPGLAFSLGGVAGGVSRLGRGGGFYDRLLSRPRLRAKTIGVCFDAQIFPVLPREEHDRAVDTVISESGISGNQPSFL